jgi:hypothetical protein
MYKKNKPKKKIRKPKISFTSKLMTAYGGTYLLSNFFEKFKIKEFIEENWIFKETSGNSLGIFPKVLTYWLSIIAGGKRFSHIMFLTHSMEVLAKTFAVEKLSKAPSTLTRFITKFNRRVYVEAFKKNLWSYMASWIPWDKIKEDWLDGDSTVITRYGNQDGSKVGYNPIKRGRASHHPLLLFLGNSDYSINLWNRSGNTHTANNIIGFLKESLDMIGERITIMGLRLDSGFYEEKILKFIEDQELKFIVSARLYRPLQKLIYSISEWTKVEKGIEVATLMYKPNPWSKEYLHIVIRQNIGVRKKASGKQLKLFSTDDESCRYRYSTMVTNFDEDAKTIWDYYKPRANCENRIGESKEDFGLCGFCLKSFWATELAMLLRMLLFNLFVYFRSEILNTQRAQLKTIRPKYFILPGILGGDDKRPALRLGVKSKKLREKLNYVNRLILKLKLPIKTNCNAVGVET